MTAALAARPVLEGLDLLVDPWLPAVDSTGGRVELGLLDCLARAHDLREIVDPSPLVTCAIHRFLAAILQSATPVDGLDAWADIWDAGRLSESVVERVETACAGRLRLFDSEHPFYQSVDIPLDAHSNGALKSVGFLFPEASTGSNVTHFSHHGDDAHAYCPVCCVHGLLLQPAFATSGGAGFKPSINGVPPIYVLPRGSSLFETLLLNHVVPLYQPAQRTPRDPGPLWIETNVVGPKDERNGAGFVESLTWPARRIRLIPDAGGWCSRCGRAAPTLTRRMIFSPGRSLTKGLVLWNDPWVAYVERTSSTESKRGSVRPRPEHDVWRDFSGLFLATGDENRTGDIAVRRVRPSVLGQADRLVHEQMIVWQLRVDTVAMRTDMKAKVFEWRQDSFIFPAELLDGRATREIDAALLCMERVADALAQAILRLHPAAERATPDWTRLRKEMADSIVLWTRAFWQSLELPFRESLNDSRLRQSSNERATWLSDWTRRVRTAGRDTLHLAHDAVEADGDVLRRQVASEAVFNARIWRILSHPTEGATP